MLIENFAPRFLHSRKKGVKSEDLSFGILMFSFAVVGRCLLSSLKFECAHFLEVHLGIGILFH